MDTSQAEAGLMPYSIYHECSLDREYRGIDGDTGSTLENKDAIAVPGLS